MNTATTQANYSGTVLDAIEAGFEPKYTEVELDAMKPARLTTALRAVEQKAAAYMKQVQDSIVLAEEDNAEEDNAEEDNAEEAEAEAEDTERGFNSTHNPVYAVKDGNAMFPQDVVDGWLGDMEKSGAIAISAGMQQLTGLIATLKSGSSTPLADLEQFVVTWAMMPFASVVSCKVEYHNVPIVGRYANKKANSDIPYVTVKMGRLVVSFGGDTVADDNDCADDPTFDTYEETLKKLTAAISSIGLDAPASGYYLVDTINKIADKMHGIVKNDGETFPMALWCTDAPTFTAKSKLINHGFATVGRQDVVFAKLSASTTSSYNAAIAANAWRHGVKIEDTHKSKEDSTEDLAQPVS